MGVTPSEAAATLRRREAEETAAVAEHAAATLGRLRAALVGFVGPGERLWLIGSLAWGGFGARSDVDLVLDGVSRDRLLPLERLVTRATGAEVDLMDLADLPQSFQVRVQREGLPLP